MWDTVEQTVARRAAHTELPGVIEELTQSPSAAYRGSLYKRRKTHNNTIVADVLNEVLLHPKGYLITCGRCKDMLSSISNLLCLYIILYHVPTGKVYVLIINHSMLSV